MIDTVDVIRSKTFILDAQERGDGFVEAIHLNNEDIEELLLFKPNLEAGEPVIAEIMQPKDKNIEMYRWDQNIKTFFHSKKTLNRYKKNRKNDADEPILQTSN